MPCALCRDFQLAAKTVRLIHLNILCRMADSTQGTSEAAIRKLCEVELLPKVVYVLEQINNNKISPKNVENETGPIRVELNNLKRLVQGIEGLNESIQDRREHAVDLQNKINKKIELLNLLQSKVFERFGVPQKAELSKPDTEAIKSEEMPTEEKQEPEEMMVDDVDMI